MDRNDPDRIINYYVVTRRSNGSPYIALEENAREALSNIGHTFGGVPSDFDIRLVATGLRLGDIIERMDDGLYRLTHEFKQKLLNWEERKNG